MNFPVSEQFADKFASMSAAMRPGHIFTVYNTQGRLVFLSPRIREVLGYTVEEFMANNWAHMVEDTMNDKAEKYLEQSLAGQFPPTHPVLYEHVNGGSILLEASHWPIFDSEGKVSRIEGFLRDITGTANEPVSHGAIQS